MSKRLNELAEIVLDRVYTYGYQQRAAEAEQCRADDDLLAAKRKLAEVTADRDHWRESRRVAIEAGELMQAEIETLRSQLADAKREASDDNAERERLRAFVSLSRQLIGPWISRTDIDRLSAALRDIATSNPAPASESEPNAELERLRAFVGEVRKACRFSGQIYDAMKRVNMAVAELDAGGGLGELDTPANPAPASEPTGGAE